MQKFLFVLAGIVFSVCASQCASAKTCKCEQHKAEATAGNSCSLSESVDFCEISFSSEESTPDAENFQQKVMLLGPIPNFTPESYAFAAMNIREYPNKLSSAGALAALALSALPLEQVPIFAKSFNALFSNPEAIEKDFNEDGCLDVNNGELRVLIIAQQSERDRQCKQ